MTDEEYKKLTHIVKIANNRLKRMQEFTGKDVSWSAYYLQSKLDNLKVNAWSNNFITISKEMSNDQLQRVYNATRNFLTYKTSTITGIKKSIKETTNAIGYNFDVTKEEAETLYRLSDDDTFKYITEHSNAKASEVWAIIEEAKEKRHMGLDRFIKKVYEMAEVTRDKEMTMNIISLYNKEIRGK